MLRNPVIGFHTKEQFCLLLHCKRDVYKAPQWRLKYEHCDLPALSKLASGEILKYSVFVSGKAIIIEVFAGRLKQKADGEDLTSFTINVLYEDGRVVPYADNLISCRIEGEVKIAVADCGNQPGNGSLKAPY